MKLQSFAALFLVVAPLFASAAQFEGTCGNRQIFRVSQHEVQLTNPLERFVGKANIYVSVNGNTYAVNPAAYSASLTSINQQTIPCYLIMH